MFTLIAATLGLLCNKLTGDEFMISLFCAAFEFTVEIVGLVVYFLAHG